MITYSVSLKTNPADATQPQKAYGRIQINETIDLHQFSNHIALHNSKYCRGDIYAVLATAVRCLRELVKMGYKVSLGDLGAFCPSISCEGAESIAGFTTGNLATGRRQWRRWRCRWQWRRCPHCIIVAAISKGCRAVDFCSRHRPTL